MPCALRYFLRELLLSEDSFLSLLLFEACAGAPDLLLLLSDDLAVDAGCLELPALCDLTLAEDLEAGFSEAVAADLLSVPEFCPPEDLAAGLLLTVVDDLLSVPEFCTEVDLLTGLSLTVVPDLLVSPAFCSEEDLAAGL